MSDDDQDDGDDVEPEDGQLSDDDLDRVSRTRGMRDRSRRRDRDRRQQRSQADQEEQEEQGQQAPQAQQEQQMPHAEQGEDGTEQATQVQQATEAEQAPQEGEGPVFEPVTQREHDTFYLTEELRRELTQHYKQLSLDLQGEWDVDLDAQEIGGRNRYFRPAALLLGAQQLQEMEADEIRGLLEEEELLDDPP